MRGISVKRAAAMKAFFRSESSSIRSCRSFPCVAPKRASRSPNTSHSNRSIRLTRRRSRTQGSRGHFCGTLRTFAGLPPSASAQTREEIATLKAQVAGLQSLVASLQTSNTTLQGQIGSLQGQVGSLQTSNATLQSQVGSLQTNDTTLQTGDTALRTQVTAPAEPVDYGPARSRVGSFRQCRSQSGERRDWTLHHF
jgi:uncharacterized phage infection (PIP) family protein YhgE